MRTETQTAKVCAAWNLHPPVGSISLADALRGCCDVGGGGRASLVHHVLTLTARWKKKSPRLLFHRDPGGEKMNGLRIQVSSWSPPPPRLTLTSVPQCSYGDQTLQAPNASNAFFFRFVFFPPVCRIFFFKVHIYLPVPIYSYSELFSCLRRHELWIRHRLTCQMTSALMLWRWYYLFPVTTVDS